MALPSIMTSLPLVFLGLSFLPLLLLLARKRKGKTVAPKLPPGPAKLPLIGNLHQLGKHMHRSLWQLSQQHGPLMYLKLGKIPTLVVSSPSMAREILKTHDHECCSRPLLIPSTKLSYGCLDVAFAPYGDQWRELRKVCIIELFNNKKVLSFRSIREEEVDRTMNLISSCSSHLTPINLSKVLFSLSGSIVCRTAFGRGYHGGEEGRFHKILKEAQAMLGGFFVADYLPTFGWIDMLTGMQARLDKIFLELDNFYQRLIDEHTGSSRPQYGQVEDTIDALLRIQKDANYITQDHIKAVLMNNIFIAGTDTSSSTVEWAMAELMRHPQAMKKAQDEVRGFVGRKGRVEESDLHQLHYIKSVVKEVMRLHPAAPLLVPRETLRHFMIDGYDIPPKTMVIINAWAMGRDTNTWHMPNEFYPERFMDGSVELKGHGFELVPFGEGRRICPGKHLGLLVVELVLANLLYCFDWELPSGMTIEDIDMEEAAGITVHRRAALCLVAKRYSEMDC